MNIGQAFDDTYYMNLALAQARQAAAQGEIPIGAVVVQKGRILAQAHNMTQRLGDVTAHAEMLAITAAANALGGKILTDCTLYVTVEPCLMCAGAIAWARPARVVYGAPEPRIGYTTITARNPLHPRTAVTQGVLAQQATQLMKDFFAAKRKS